MHAYLFISKSNREIEKAVTDFLNKRKLNRFDASVSKIEDSKNLLAFLSLKLDKNTGIVINDLDSATPEALNAFLKTLEEPQENVTFVLSATSIYKILPTIISRCQVIRLKNSQNETEEPLYSGFSESTLTEKLKTIDKIKKREGAQEFIKGLTLYYHSILSKSGDLKIAKLLKILQKTYDSLEKNGNPGLHLTNFVVKSNKL